MPDRPLSRSGGAVPVPNRLFDQVLPTLRDTELRVLLVVVRQTLGWRDAGGEGKRKSRDWISHGQLVKRTGRGSEAVSAAVDALVRKGLIVVENAAGRALETTGERRRVLGRLYYRLGDMWKTPEEGLPGKPKTTTERENKRGVGSPILYRSPSQPALRRSGWQRAAAGPAIKVAPGKGARERPDCAAGAGGGVGRSAPTS